MTVAGFAIPDGWSAQAFCFALDPSPEQAACLRRQFGGRRYARNWAVRTLKDDLDRYHATGEEQKAMLARLRKRWNQVKDAECIDAETGEVWWPEVSKEAFADGIKGAVDGYWNWQASRAGNRGRVGFPRFARKGRDRDRVTFTTGAIRVEPDRRHVTLPGSAPSGSTRTPAGWNASWPKAGPGSSRSPCPERHPADSGVPGDGPAPHPARAAGAGPGSGWMSGCGFLPPSPSPDGYVIERVPNPRPLETALKELRHLCRERSRRTRGSRRYTETQQKITRLHRRVASIRGHHLHVLTTRLAKTHGEIVVEGLDAAGMLRQKGLAGAGARRRGLSDSALGETRRQLGYKTGWYGSRLMVADRWYPSSKTCHACGHVQDIGWDELWTCAGCGTRHQRDDNAAVNLARYEPPARVIAPSAQSGPPSSAEPTVRPGPARPGRRSAEGNQPQSWQPTPRRGADEMSTIAHSSATDALNSAAAETISLIALLGVLAWAVTRPRGWPEAVVAVPAAAVLVIATGAIPLGHAGAEAGQLGPVIGFLAAVLVLAQFCDEEGLFRACGAWMARWAAGRPRRLLAAVFALASVITAVLSLDATVVLLTPVVFATAARLGRPARSRTCTPAPICRTPPRCCCRSPT